MPCNNEDSKEFAKELTKIRTKLVSNSFEEAQLHMISELKKGCDIFKFAHPISNQEPYTMNNLMKNISHEALELTKDHHAILFKTFFTTWEFTENQINWSMDVVKSEFTKLTGCSLCLEQKSRAVFMIIQMTKKNKQDMWEKLKNKLKRRTTRPVDTKTRCNFKNFTTEHTMLSVQGQAFCILHPDQKMREKVPTLNEEKQLTSGDRSSMVRLIEKCGEKTIIQHTKAVIKPNSSSPPLSQLTTARCDSMARCSDSISLTNSFTSTCTGSFPTESSMRTEKTGESGDEMKQAAASSSTRVGSI